MKLPGVWQQKLGAELAQPYFVELEAFLKEERATQTIFPPEEEVFAAFELTSFENVKVLLLGQDPYPGPGHAHHRGGPEYRHQGRR